MLRNYFVSTRYSLIFGNISFSDTFLMLLVASYREKLVDVVSDKHRKELVTSVPVYPWFG